MIVDMHAHYAMHLMDELDQNPLRVLQWAMSAASSELPEVPGVELSEEERNRYKRHRDRRRRRAVFLSLFRWINMLFNYRSLTSGPGVTLELMKKGRVRVVLSPLIDPLNEFGALPTWFVIVAALAALAVLAIFMFVCFLIFDFVSSANWAAGGALWMLRAAVVLTAVVLMLVLMLLGIFALHNRLSSCFDWSLDELPGSPPRREYVYDLRDQRGKVETDLEALGDWAVVAHNVSQLDGALCDKKIAIIHCVEGGFQLGATPDDIRGNVAQLAQDGVAYVTLAHLFWRRVATNAPSFPFLSDGEYQFLARQPREGLTDLGRAAVEAMVRNGVLIDVTHMSEQAINETITILEGLEDEEPKDESRPLVPLIASHIACRFRKYKYNLSCGTISKIATRKGVMGVIFSDHWMHDGQPKDRPTFEIVGKHIDRLYEATGSHQFAAIGSDLDGFIKPMLRGLEDMGYMRKLADWLVDTYGEETAELILHGNALRVLRSAWRKPRGGAKQATPNPAGS